MDLRATLHEVEQVKKDIAVYKQPEIDYPSSFALAAFEIATLKKHVEILQKESAAAWDKCEERRLENVKLLDILVDITHHDGALEEFRSRWEPVVQAELKRRLST